MRSKIKTIRRMVPSDMIDLRARSVACPTFQPFARVNVCRTVKAEGVRPRKVRVNGRCTALDGAEQVPQAKPKAEAWLIASLVQFPRL